MLLTAAPWEEHPVVGASPVSWTVFVFATLFGLAVNLPSNYVIEFLQLYTPCISYRSTLRAGGLFFWLSMKDYIEAGFTGDMTLLLMTWHLMTFGDALSGRRGTCRKDDHGFSKDFVNE